MTMVLESTTASSTSTGIHGVHDEIHKLQAQLSRIYDDMSLYEPPIPMPPVMDSSLDDSPEDQEIAARGGSSTNERLPGLRALKESLRQDLEALEKFWADPDCASLAAPSINAPYLIAVWNEVLAAPQPIVTISKSFVEREEHIKNGRRRGTGPSKSPTVKVDVVADNGRRWIRVNTIKNSRILAEFREIDSYLTDSDEDESESSADEIPLPPSLAQTTFDNSVLRMGRSLLSAAAIVDKQRIIHEGFESELSGPIQITIRLTRLDPNPQDNSQYDPRISRTIDELRQMGIDIQLGELDTLPAPSPLPSRILCPTMKINLDLSILIALISDLSHSCLPRCTEEADVRFVPPASYLEWKRKRKEGTARIDAVVEDKEQGRIPDTAKHSRALINQALQEMDRGLIQEIHDRLASSMKLSASASGNPTPPISTVEFWTTVEARDRCLRIVAKIGGPNEKRRAQALFSPSSSAAQTNPYWSNSRFTGGFIPIPPVYVFTSDSPKPSSSSSPSQRQESSDGNDLNSTSPASFFEVLEATCMHILSQESVPHPKAPPPHAVTTSNATREVGDGDGYSEDPEFGGIYRGTAGDEIQRATVTKANPKLTAHTVHSMLQGAKRGWTTLTANKGSVKAILKEIKDLRGSLIGGLTLGQRNSENSVGGDSANAEVEKAAIWIIDPRSLSESMRSDLVS